MNSIKNPACDRIKEKNKIPPTSPEDTGQTKCKEIAEKVAKFKADKEIALGIVNAIGSAISPIAALSNLVSKLSPSNSTHSMFINAVKQISNMNISSDIDSVCNLSNDISQSINIDFNPACVPIICGPKSDYSSDDGYLECVKKVTSFNNNTISNTVETQQQCNMSATIQAISAQSQDTSVQALVSLLQSSSGVGSSNKSDVMNCNEISSTINSNTFSDIYSCCTSSISSKQTIAIKGGCGDFSNNNLSNIAKTPMQQCLIKNGIINKNTGDQKTSIKNEYTSEQKSNNTAAVIGSSCVLTIFIFVIMYIIYKLYS